MFNRLSNFFTKFPCYFLSRLDKLRSTVAADKPIRMYPKIADKLKPSPLFAANGISYEPMNRVFVQSKSMPHFAKNAMLHLFTRAELATRDSVRAANSLDEKRVGIIRQLVSENSAPLAGQWSECIGVMNKELKKLKQHTERIRTDF